MIKGIVHLLVILSLSSAAYAKKADDKSLKYKVTFGDQVTKFEVNRDHTGGQIRFESTNGRRESFKISESNYQYLVSEAQKVKGNNERRFCRRNYIEMKLDGNKSVLSCLNSSSGVAKQLRANTNFLSMFF